MFSLLFLLYHYYHFYYYYYTHPKTFVNSTAYHHDHLRLNSFHLRCLRHILGISWQDRVTNTTVLESA